MANNVTRWTEIELVFSSGNIDEFQASTKFCMSACGTCCCLIKCLTVYGLDARFA